MTTALEIVLFTAVAVGLYLLADRLLVHIETVRGARLPYRDVIYFVIILALALGTFQLIQAVLR